MNKNVSGHEEKIRRFIQRVIRRIRLRNTMRIGIYGLLGALGGGIFLEVLARLLPIADLPKLLLIFGGVVLLGGLLLGFLFPVNDRKAILEADSHGLEERIITAYGLLDEQSAMSELQKADAARHIETYDMRKMTLWPNRRLGIIASVLALIFIGMIFLPNPMTGKAKDLEALRKAKKETVKLLKQEEKKLEKDSKLSEKEKAELKRELSEFRKQIKAARTKLDMAKATLQLEKKLQLMGQKNNEKRLSDIAKALENKEMTKKMSEAIKSGNAEKLKALMEQMAKALKNKDKEELKRLAEALKKAAEELKDDKKTAEKLAKLAQDLKDGKLSESEAELAELGDSLGKMMAADGLDGEFGELAGQLRKASPMELADNGNLTLGELAGQGNGNMPGNGNGNGNSGNGGNGSGKGSSGAGNGSNPGTENQTATNYGNGIGHRNSAGTGKQSDFEKIWTSKTVGGNGERSSLKGKTGTGGTTAQAVTEKGITTAGTVVSYDKVIGDYEKNALDGLSGRDLPPAMERLIRDYFTQLGE